MQRSVPRESTPTTRPVRASIAGEPLSPLHGPSAVKNSVRDPRSTRTPARTERAGIDVFPTLTTCVGLVVARAKAAEAK